MEHITLFTDILPEEQERMRVCFKVREKVFQNGETIMEYPQSEYHKIFQRFYRGTAPEVREKSGTGIGLYLSRQIIEQHGGTITVASGKVRKGSTFLIQLPENGLS